MWPTGISQGFVTRNGEREREGAKERKSEGQRVKISYRKATEANRDSFI